MQSYTLLLMTMQWVLIDLMTLDICGMATGTLADRAAHFALPNRTLWQVFRPPYRLPASTHRAAQSTYRCEPETTRLLA